MRWKENRKENERKVKKKMKEVNEKVLWTKTKGVRKRKKPRKEYGG